ncbi:hypothetical protein CN918_29620 [Priestia megaterium]|nr:hypothetical protein CN918_29620 [Priestia megaterium]
MPTSTLLPVTSVEPTNLSINISATNQDIQEELLYRAIKEAVAYIEKQSVLVTTGEEVRLIGELKSGLAQGEEPKQLLRMYKKLINITV